MSLWKRACRAALLLAGLVGIVVATGFLIFGVRLVGLVSHGAAANLMRPLIFGWNRLVIAWARVAGAVDLQVEGRLPEGPGHVIVSNHQSILDIPILIATLAASRPLFVLKQELRWGVPNISPAARYSGMAFISRKRGAGELAPQFESIGRLGAKLGSERVSAVLFSEGTRSLDGNLKPFKAGGLAALLRAAPPGTLVYPVAIDGTWRARGYRSIVRDVVGLRVRVAVGEPIRCERCDDNAAIREVADRCQAFCAEALARWRGEPAAAITSQECRPPGGP